MGGTRIQQEIYFEDVGMSFSRNLDGEYGTTWGFLVYSEERYKTPIAYTEDKNIADVRLVDANDERGYKYEIDLISEGVTKLYVERDDVVISMEVVVKKPAIIFSKNVIGVVGKTYGFLIYTEDRNEIPKVYVENTEIAEVKLVDKNDERGYKYEVKGLQVGETHIVAEKNNKQYKMYVKFDKNNQIKGIDVSKFQKNIDWSKVKNDGIEFAFIRVGGRYGASGAIYKDEYFNSNIRGALNAGINVGVYFFTQAITEEEAVEEARYVYNNVKNYNITYPIVIDTEYLSGGRHSDISRQQRTNVVKAFCEEIQRLGYTPMIYSNTNWLNNNLYMNQLSQFLVWVAQYNSVCTYKGRYACWQYTSSGRVDGINGNVDMNIWYK